ncbi:hypothetical protein IMZ48_08525 [Candidatus Bathyarchaeota archaeon]|nr:hypothetical protein [Candidatus Bathyarchaeota archaeon]
MLANLAYSTSCIEQALPVLEKTIVFYPDPTAQSQQLLCDDSIPPSAYIMKTTGFTGDITYSSVLEYDMMRALVFIQERRWAPAMDALERCISFPTDDASVSNIMLQAFYKWTLVSLILHGRIIGLPGSPLPAASHAFESQGEVYIFFDLKFAEDNAPALLEHRVHNSANFAADGNLGLVDEVLLSFQKRQIISLGDLYSKISIPEIRQLTQSAVTGKCLDTDDEVLQLVREMIDAKILSGRLHSPGEGQPDHLEFLPASEILTEAEFARQICAEFADLKELDAVAKTTNAGLTLNKDYVRHLQRERKRREKDPGGDLGVDFDTQVEDEDLMLGIGASEG